MIKVNCRGTIIEMSEDTAKRIPFFESQQAFIKLGGKDEVTYLDCAPSEFHLLLDELRGYDMKDFLQIVEKIDLKLDASMSHDLFYFIMADIPSAIIALSRYLKKNSNASVIRINELLKKYHELKNENNKINDDYNKERRNNWSPYYPSKEAEEKVSKMSYDINHIEGRIKDIIYMLHPKIKNELIKIYQPI